MAKKPIGKGNTAKRKSPSTRGKAQPIARPRAASIERLPLAAFTEKAYLDYSMYVILDRALPHIGDGLKPVQRRIIYAMSELGLNAASKYKKSARTVGDVLGKFHPHGDTACYEAMVLMAQPFSYRYPLVDGQGNWGSPDDPKSFAAMRYTESRLTRFAQILLSELEQGTVDWTPNFDGTLEEPMILPARLPHVLLNGTTGIAVGMATDIPPHNLREVAAACVHLLDEPDAGLQGPVQAHQGPGLSDRGRNHHAARAKFARCTKPATARSEPRANMGKRGRRHRHHRAAVPGVGLQGHGADRAADAAEEAADGRGPARRIRSRKSDAPGDHAALQPHRPVELMSHLFATTDLEQSYRVNMNMIGLDGRPRVYNLKELLEEWIKFRIDTVRRRLRIVSITSRRGCTSSTAC